MGDDVSLLHGEHMRRFLGILLVSALFTGCTSLHFRDSDSAGVKFAKGIARVPVAVLTFGLSEAWHARERTMESWLGRHVRDLLMSWGPPSAVYDDGSGGKIIVYTENRMYVSPGYVTTTTTGSATGYAYDNIANVYGRAQSFTTYVPGQIQQWQVFRQFRVNSQGVITAYSWRGL